MVRCALIVHGGAGRINESEKDGILSGLQEAAARGFRLLREGLSAVEAAVEAVGFLEDNVLFNAGRGSVATFEGSIEMDASVMDGKSLRAGAVAGVRTIRHPARLAAAILRQGREVFLAGEAAERWGRVWGLESWDPIDLAEGARTNHGLVRNSVGTVGAIAMDRRGHLAAATSTGGRAGKREGRIGDSAVIGAGTYADDESGAASATGYGEAILRVSLAHFAVRQLEAGRAPQVVAEESLARLGRLTGGHAGLILLDRLGRCGAATNTAHMPVAWMKAGMACPQARMSPSWEMVR